jgi:exopolyphosphatase / guanosine-5'-triphosphate,3'-diphosphate pyrophosphatase
MSSYLRAVIDIGSNAIRFVVYSGAERAPTPIYNEKASISLGKAVGEKGQIPKAIITEATKALTRFAKLSEAMDVKQRVTIATAAVRDASNGQEFLAEARLIMPEIRLLTGDQEAMAGGHGILAEFPKANGIAADLGGGSLELIRLSNGVLGDRISVPMGTMKLRAMDSIATSLAGLTKAVTGQLTAKADTLFLIGGAWRAMAKLDHFLTNHPLPLIANHCLEKSRLPDLLKNAQDEELLKATKGIPQARLATLADAVALAKALAERFDSDRLIVTTSGIREGLLFGHLDEDIKRLDPVIESIRHETAGHWRFAGFGDALFEWIKPLQLADTGRDQILLHAACCFADTAWAIQPDFRPIHAARLALDGLWHGLLLEERIQIAYATFIACGGKTGWPDALDIYVRPDRLRRAHNWGLSMRLAKRLSAGVPDLLTKSSIAQIEGNVSLAYESGERSLHTGSVERRLKALAQALDVDINIDD